ncbi:MAG: saccharopine dehydrogenase NADP-binding domain-containing protein [Oligoflexales bacterium]|nr:saccharopine dehydrogenase NADP-binding domain-containing protein [Oligoflexales bacterium]
MDKNWLIYGANGYTARQIVYSAVEKGLSPILAGRNAQSILNFAFETGLPCRIFDLKSPAIDHFLKDVHLLVNCAGPFSKTARPLLESCYRTNTNYIDVSGELNSFEEIFANAGKWQEKGLTVIPGSGFDVVPSDCLAAFLKNKLPDATNLTIGIKINGTKPSHGTLRSLTEALALGGKIRRDNKLKQVPNAWKTKLITFSEHSSLSVSMPLAELSSCWHSTRIPNIQTYFSVKTRELRYIKMSRLARPFLFIPFVLEWVKKQIGLYTTHLTLGFYRKAQRSFGGRFATLKEKQKAYASRPMRPTTSLPSQPYALHKKF